MLKPLNLLAAASWALATVGPVLCPAVAAVPVRYNRDVLPILADHCFACHGFDSAQRQAGLRLDQQTGSTQELPSGARAIVPGDLQSSTLWQRITSQDESARMPPPESGKMLTELQRQTLQRWIEQGAEYEPHWAYVPPQRVQPPTHAEAVQPIDRFILARLEAARVEPSPAADRHTLIRRVTLDLTGLPPSALEVDAFVNDPRADAYERVVDRLLGSEHYGEHWARWWLDLAHYGDSDGYLQDFLRPVAWRYRQWVVDAFNRDMPFDQFTIQQLAGDLLPQASVSQRMGTGFLRNTLSNREGGADLEEYRVNQVLDRTMTVGTTWMGLTIGCAQCHDHKFDAISQREFYQLYAFFNNADEANLYAPLPAEREAWQAAKLDYDRQRAELLAPAAVPLAEIQAEWERKILHTETHPGEDFAWDRTLELLGLQWGQDLGEGQLEGLGIIKTPLEGRTIDQQQRLQDYFLRAAPAEFADRLKEVQSSELVAKLDVLANALPPVTRAPAMMHSPARRPNYIFLRGEYLRQGDEVAPATPAALPPLITGGDADRLALARWLAAPENPLTARVAVNRLWQELFGQGLVATSDNFGVRGERPSHPELLDWLAIEFIEQSWSVKSMLRTMVLSEAYRQSSLARPELSELDPTNKLLARQARPRLSGEAVRDSALAVSGLLNRTVGGPSVKPPQPDSVSKEGYANKWQPSPGADRYRRGLYTFIQRTSPFAQFVTFDLPDTSRSCTRREQSNTPLQALNLLNDPVFLEAAQALAARIERESAGDDARRLEHAFLLVLARPPRPPETERLLAYLQQQRALLQAEPESARMLLPDEATDADAAWVALCSVLLNLDEFINRE
ncbi:MAG: PSD1 and planctomycete cytochrome C domain-containing protein [Pirellulales bacterium]